MKFGSRQKSKGIGVALPMISALAILLAACGSGSADTDGDAGSADSSASGATSDSTSGDNDAGGEDGATDGETSDGDTADGVTSSEAAGTIQGRIYSDPSSFDPTLAAGVQTFRLDRQLYDTVVRRDASGSIVGGLASEWDPIDASNYEFTIRDDAYCSDGTQITAEVVAASLEYLADPSTSSAWAPLVYGTGTPTITADNGTATVTIELSEPFADLVEGLTVAQTGIICPAGLDDLEGLADGTIPGAFSGPYSLTKKEPGISYELTFNDYYVAWPNFTEPLPGSPAETIFYTISNDESTTANQMLSGQVDYADYADWSTIERFADNDAFHQNRITAYTTYLVFNERPGRIFADAPELRKAVAQAVNQEGFNNVFSNGNAEMLTTIVPASYQCANTDTSWLVPYDPAAAAEVLDGVGPIKILGNTANVAFSSGADYVYASVTDAGANAEMQKMDNATFWTTIGLADGDWDLVFIGDQNAGQTISASLTRTMGTAIEDNGRNFSASDNPEGVEALNRGLTTTDPDERCAAFMDAQKTLFDRYDVVPLAGGTTVTITSENVYARKIGEDVDPATLRVLN